MGFSLRVQGGRLRGRKIPAPPRAGRSEGQFTSALIKEAVFQIIDNHAMRPDQTAFFDLCAGSGQMALEALSRGFAPVHAAEVDRVRFAHLRKLVQPYDSDVQLHARDLRRMGRQIQTQLATGDSVVFLDPPYSFWDNNHCSAVDRLLEGLHVVPPARQLLVVLQGPAAYRPLTYAGPADGVEQRQYGRSWVSVVPGDTLVTLFPPGEG